MMLGELIKLLEGFQPAKEVAVGFSDPHSWRGIYSELAFVLTENVTIGSMLADAKSAVGTTYEGYKGGDFTMGEYSDVYIVESHSTYDDQSMKLWLNLAAKHG